MRTGSSCVQLGSALWLASCGPLCCVRRAKVSWTRCQVQPVVLQLQLSVCSATCNHPQQVWPNPFPCHPFHVLHLIADSQPAATCCSTFWEQSMFCNAGGVRTLPSVFLQAAMVLLHVGA
jgi:hypothetical protein